MAIKSQVMGDDQYLQLEVHNGGLNDRLDENIDLKNWYLETMEFSWNAISQQMILY